MRARGIVKSTTLDSLGGEAVRGWLELKHPSDVHQYKTGDELFVRADVPELVAIELKRCASELPITAKNAFDRGYCAGLHSAQPDSVTLQRDLDDAHQQIRDLTKQLQSVDLFTQDEVNGQASTSAVLKHCARLLEEGRQCDHFAKRLRTLAAGVVRDDEKPLPHRLAHAAPVKPEDSGVSIDEHLVALRKHLGCWP